MPTRVISVPCRVVTNGSFRLAVHHLLRKQRGDRMWNGVVYVQQIQTDSARPPPPSARRVPGNRADIGKAGNWRLLLRGSGSAESPGRAGSDSHRIMKWTSWPRLANSRPSSVATMPLPPYVG